MINAPIRVVHIVKSMNQGGAETMIMNLYRNIDRTKIQFDFICMDEKKGKYDDEIRQLNGNIYTVSSPDLGRMKNLMAIYRILKKQKFKAIHTHVSFYSGFVNLVALLAGIPIRVVHSHTTNDLRKQSIMRKMYSAFSRFLIKITSNVKLSCGELAGKYLYKNSHYQIFNNGVDLDKFMNISQEEIENLKKEFLIKQDDFVIGHVGRFEPVKNHMFFISLAKQLLKEGKKFKIALVGSGSKYEEIKELVQKEQLENYILLPGARDDIPVWMNIFDIFVFPSLYEGFPLVVVEALAGKNKCYLSDKISKETNIIDDMVEFFSLEEPMNKVTQQILKVTSNIEKDVIKEELIKKGYSIKDSVDTITNIYLK